LRFADANTLIVNDGYHGIFSLDVVTLKVRHLFNTKSQQPTTPNTDGLLDPVVNLPTRIVNDLEIGANGVIYFTDSSFKWSRAEHPIEVGFPGRSFKSFWTGRF